MIIRPSDKTAADVITKLYIGYLMDITNYLGQIKVSIEF